MDSYLEIGNKKAFRKCIVQIFILGFNIIFGTLTFFSKKEKFMIILFIGNCFFSFIYILTDYYITLIKITDFTDVKNETIHLLEKPIKFDENDFFTKEREYQNSLLNSNIFSRCFTKIMFLIGALHRKELNLD